MKAMILAAGFGTRLRPYSLIRPKPLFPVLNTPLLLATVQRLKAAGFSSITVNCHHLREQVRDALEDVPGVTIQEEREILGTGGGLRQALPTFSAAPVLVVNGDIYHTVDLGAVYRHHLGSDSPVTMVLHDRERYNSVRVSGNRIAGFGRRAEDSTLLAYTGIQVIDPVVVAGIAEGRFSCIIEYYRKLLDTGGTITPLVLNDIGWTDMGTPEDYLELHRQLLCGEIPVWDELRCSPGASSSVVDPKAELGCNVEFQEWASVGKAVVGDNTVIRRSVVWDGSVIAPDSCVSDAVVTPVPDK